MIKRAECTLQPVGSVEALARLLAFPLDELLPLADHADLKYEANPPKRKSSGGERITYRVLPPLEIVQRRIKNRIFAAVKYPDYLYGVTGTDYIDNARNHSKKKVVIREDARNFFPSIRAEAVRRLWQYFFSFPPEVAEVLTKLTTYKGFVPQGARTSSAIAALIFWDKEPQLESDLRALGFEYSRYVDDMTLSAKLVADRDSIYDAKRRVYGMLRSLNVKQNRKKARKGITASSQCQKVHGLVVNKDKVSVPKPYRRNIRHEIYIFERKYGTDRTVDTYIKAYRRLLGRAKHVERLHPAEGEETDRQIGTSCAA